MIPKKTYRVWLFYIIATVAIISFLIKFLPDNKTQPSTQVTKNVESSPVPLPTPFTKYTAPKLVQKNSYAVFLIGDSMTAALGPHPSRLSQRLNDAYPDASFIIDNYGIGSVSVLSFSDLLNHERTIDGKLEPAVLNRNFDILVVESFANNPLSEMPLEEGLQKQREVLDQTIGRLVQEKPESVIILLATIAPSNRYGLGSTDLSPEARKKYADERRAYLENFINYAKEKEFPLVNAYEASRLPSGDVKPGLISEDGYIHPSQDGIEFIQDSIADLIIDTQIIPKQ